MDFESMGMAIGYAKSVKNVVRVANAEIRKAEAIIADLEARLAAETRARQLAEGRLAGVVEAAPDAGRELRAELAYEAVIAEEISDRRIFGLRRIHWRRDEYRSLKSAWEARERTARQAYDDAL